MTTTIKTLPATIPAMDTIGAFKSIAGACSNYDGPRHCGNQRGLTA
jgi:hypothetical protein